MKIVNIHSKQPYTIYIGRVSKTNPGLFGNKFVVGVHGPRGECVRLFREWFYSEEQDAIEYRRRVDAMIDRDSILGCFCKPASCHGDVISEYVLSKSSTTKS